MFDNNVAHFVPYSFEFVDQFYFVILFVVRLCILVVWVFVLVENGRVLKDFQKSGDFSFGLVVLKEQVFYTDFIIKVVADN